jgi:hypothetical protein
MGRGGTAGEPAQEAPDIATPRAADAGNESLERLITAATVKPLELGSGEFGLRFKIADGDETLEMFKQIIAGMRSVEFKARLPAQSNPDRAASRGDDDSQTNCRDRRVRGYKKRAHTRAHPTERRRACPPQNYAAPQ